MTNIIGNGEEGYKAPSSFPDEWGEAKEVTPIYPEPQAKNCAACGLIFIPKWHTAMRCEFCRKNKIPHRGEEINNKPF